MRESLTDSLNVSAFKGTRCEDARIIRCTESDRDKCESEVKKVNSLKDSDKAKLYNPKNKTWKDQPEHKMEQLIMTFRSDLAQPPWTLSHHGTMR